MKTHRTKREVMNFYNIRYYVEGDGFSDPDRTYTLGRYLHPSCADAEGRKELAEYQTHLYSGQFYTRWTGDLIFVRVEDVDGKCDLRNCHKPAADNRYVKMGGIWYHLCEEHYQQETSTGAWAYGDSMEAIGRMLAGELA